MSKLTNKGKIITRFEIGFDNETKVAIDSLKGKLDEVTRALSVKNDSHGDRLLAAMQAEAANDAPQPEFLQLGQWVFEGQPKKFVTAHVNSYGKAAISSMQISDIEPSDDAWAVTEDAQVRIPTCLFRALKGKFNATNWQNSAIARETINDVDYLSGNDLDECVPHIDDVLDQPNWLSESVPQITQADMQLIFIKNLSETLIQRMHSMDRFSEDDYAMGGDKLMAWDIVVGKPYKTKEEDHNVVRFGVISCQSRDLKVLEVLSFNESYCNSRGESLAVYFSENNTYRTITEAELPAFRAALEACYA
ncbi:hypothetical protein [Psychrobacter sp. S4(2024)]|uniref:hypothetical protein n=1 Tax=Psychrobacter sp. S4(2024) TaxID=3111913 RepID=UPI002FE1B9B6